ncbi:phenylacetate-CoA oxygenase subunit PaaI, partial [Staphylococcus capitis]|nr:phenylacetate-CoA oxygenase subunit PaaI [Staphylococcus capitis]
MNDHDSAFAGLVDADTLDQWAFGTSFDDPLAGVDTTLADGIDATDLATYCLMLADDALISAQRLTQWCTNSPELE